MASYNGSLDLLSLNGAKVFSGIDQKNPNRAFVCIPIDLNDIKVATSRNDANKQLAGLRVNIWPLSENYKNAARRSAAERGDTNANIPTHELTQSFSNDYIHAAIKTFPKLVEQVKQANKDRNPDIVNQDPNDENTHLFKAIRNRMNKRIAMLYQPQTQPQQQTAYPQQFAQASSPTSYVAPAESSDPLAGVSYDDLSDDDLPF